MTRGKRKARATGKDSVEHQARSTPSKELVEQFIDAAVADQDRARRLLSTCPQLLDARWLHDETALHFLAVEGFTEGVRFLAESGADVNAVNRFGDSALIDVARLGNIEIAAILLQHGANPNADSTTENNPLDCAVRTKNAALVALLLDAGADGRYATHSGESVFDALPASGIKREQILEVLARHGIVPKPGED